MTDIFSPDKRRAIMSAVQSKNTSPELIVRKMVFSSGYRYRLHDVKLPGNPDLVFAGRKKVIFVNGCYWHRHNCSKGRSMPKTREDFWKRKFETNVKRDTRNRRDLKKMGWDVLVVWECQTKSSKEDILRRKIICFLEH